jgi:DNA-binding IclR family transcriptional regulator
MEAERGNAVAKAIIVLQALRRIPDGASARQLAGVVDLPRSTVQRILGTLVSSGMIIQEPTHQRYQIGPQALLIGLGYRQGLGLVSLARPPMVRLRDETGETVGLSVRVGDSRVFIDEVQSRQPLRFASELGRQYPLWSGASGRILLLGLTDSELAAALADDEHSEALFRVIERSEREALLEAARRDGYAIARNETIGNVSSVAVPITDRSGRVVAALSVSGPTTRLSEDSLTAVREALQRVGAAISADLDHPAEAFIL